MKTKHWPYLVLLAYFVINILVVMGMSYAVFFKAEIDLDGLIPFALITAGVLLICQIFLFDVKVAAVENRPVPKRRITATSILVALVMAILTFTALVILIFVIAGEGGGQTSDEAETLNTILLILFFAGSWFFWAYAFLVAYKENMPGEFLRKMVNRVMAGSILELLIAIPSHIIFRSRGDCCAPAISYFGIITGITVILFAFGPGIVFLYLKRMQNKKPRSERKD